MNASTLRSTNWDLTLVIMPSSFANQMDLDVVEVNPAGRTVMLSGTVAQLNIAFGVLLTDFSCSSGTYRGHSGPVNVTDELRLWLLLLA